MWENTLKSHSWRLLTRLICCATVSYTRKKQSWTQRNRGPSEKCSLYQDFSLKTGFTVVCVWQSHEYTNSHMSGHQNSPVIICAVYARQIMFSLLFHVNDAFFTRVKFSKPRSISDSTQLTIGVLTLLNFRFVSCMPAESRPRTDIHQAGAHRQGQLRRGLQRHRQSNAAGMCRVVYVFPTAFCVSQHPRAAWHRTVRI